MRFLSPLFLLFAVVLIPIGVWSQSNSPQSPVEISGEPRHHPKFENEFVRIWDVTVPAGDATLWHAHRNDNVVVTLGGASLRIETVGAATAEVEWNFGDVKFGKATYVHRAMNVGTTPFHNLTIELLRSPPFLKTNVSVSIVSHSPRANRLRCTRTSCQVSQSQLLPARSRCALKEKTNPISLNFPRATSAGAVDQSSIQSRMSAKRVLRQWISN